MPALDRDKLAKMLGMLGSRHDGEVAAAGRSARTLLEDAGTTWSEVLTSPDGAGPSERNKLAEAEAENRRLIVELAQRQLDIDNLIAKHQQEIRELQGAKHREKTRGFASMKTAIGWATMGFALRTVAGWAALGFALRTVAGWAALGFAAWFIGTMIWGTQRTQEIQVLRGGSLAAPAGTEAWRLNSQHPEIDSSSLRWISERVQGWSRALGWPAQYSPTLKTPTRTRIEQ
jgi:hypothetical protein